MKEVVRTRLRAAGFDGQAAGLVDNPHTWAALGCLQHGAPRGVVARALEPHLNGAGTRLVEALRPLLNDPSLGDIVGQMRAKGLAAAVNLSTRANPPRTANRLLKAALWMHDTLATGLPLVSALDHPVGMEVEIFPSTTGPAPTEPPFISHDRLYEAMAAQLKAHGYTVTLHRNPARFHIKETAVMYPVLTQRFHHAGRSVELTRVYGSGAMLIYLRQIDGEAYTSTRLWGGRGRTIAESDDEAYAAVAKVLGLASAHSVRMLAASGDASRYERTDILMIKAGNTFLQPEIASGKPAGDDFCNVRVEQAGPGHYRVVPLNGTLADGQGALTFAARDVADVIAQLRAHVAAHPECIAKRDEITGLSVQGVEGEFKWLYEQYCGGPLAELVTPKLRARDYIVLQLILNALAQLHVVGTTEHTQIGIHVHGNIPTKVAGRYSIAPLLNTVRAGIRYAPLLETLFPPHPNRRPFIQPMPRRLQRRVMQKGYVTAPTAIDQILCVMADFAIDMPLKYSFLNYDGYLAKLGEEMLADGTLTLGQRFNRIWHERRYGFHVVDGPNGPDIRVVYKGKAISLLRMKPGMRKATIEARGFDTPEHVTRNADGSVTHTIDVASAMLYLKLMAARSVLDGTVPFMGA